MGNIELPPKYYHENFEYLLGFVKEKYKEILKKEEWSFLRKYYTLSEDAQCLFIRFINRKGEWFKTDNLKYPEIGNIEEALLQLRERSFLSTLNLESHKTFVSEITGILTKSELTGYFDYSGPKNAKREEVEDWVLKSHTKAEIIRVIQENINPVRVEFNRETSFLIFLFFGNRAMDMTEFVMRDLGLIQYYKQDEDHLVAQFETRKEAEDKWLVSELFHTFSEVKEIFSAGQIFSWYENVMTICESISEIALPSFEKLLFQIGRQLERKKAYDLAVKVYSGILSTPARERQARCLEKTGYYEEARRVCEEMLLSPQNADEQFFAEYFSDRLAGKKNKKKTTEWLKTSEEISIDSAFKSDVELGVAEYFMEQGYRAAFSENLSWRALFGLLFWDIIFDPDSVAFHHPFQRRPSDLYMPDFFKKRGDKILKRLDELETNDELVYFLKKVFSKNLGISNAFVLWEEEIWEMVKILSYRIPLEALKSVLKLMAENLTDNSHGLPDLLIWNDEEYELIEVKSPNDMLSNQQLFWLRRFKDLGIRAKVLRVKFI